MQHRLPLFSKMALNKGTSRSEHKFFFSEQGITRPRMDGNEQRDSLPSADWRSPKEIEAHDQSWSFLPIIIGAAATCLLLYFFLTPAFNAEEESAAGRSARPGATTQTTPTRHDAFR
jgi:hypothetical protein